MAAIDPQCWIVSFDPHVSLWNNKRPLCFLKLVSETTFPVPLPFWIDPRVFRVVFLGPNDTPSIWILLKVKMHVLTITLYGISGQTNDPFTRHVLGMIWMRKANEVASSHREVESKQAPDSPRTAQPDITSISGAGW
jgi:hypothetical protein